MLTILVSKAICFLHVKPLVHSLHGHVYWPHISMCDMWHLIILRFRCNLVICLTIYLMGPIVHMKNQFLPLEKQRKHYVQRKIEVKSIMRERSIVTDLLRFSSTYIVYTWISSSCHLKTNETLYTQRKIKIKSVTTKGESQVTCKCALSLSLATNFTSILPAYIVYSWIISSCHWKNKWNTICRGKLK